MNLNKFLLFLENNFPTKYAMQNDKVGLQVHSGKLEINNLLIAYELTDEVVREAINLEIDTILVFHPLIFSPITQISQDDRTGKLVTLLLQKQISLISLHTRFDVYRYGTSFLFAKKLGLEFQEFLIPNEINEKFGMGIIGNFNQPVSLYNLLQKIYSITNNPIRYIAKGTTEITKVGIVGGSGTSFLNLVLNKSIDAFITADTSYHNYHLVDGKIALIDPGHYETEQFIVPALNEFLTNNLENEKIKIFSSQIVTNPVKYFYGILIENNKDNIINNK